jgi:two-component system, chemotaxis family, response regulator Rcp1
MKVTTEVLLVDDNPGDTDLIADVLERNDRPIHVHSVADGLEAMAFLHCEGKYANARPPRLIVLDLNMPRKGGQAVLAEVKSDPALLQIPIVVFSTSKARADIASSYQLGANSYVCKPGDLKGFVSAVTAIGDFWLDVTNVPWRKEQ